MNETNHERWSEDVAAYMLGALEPGEAAELERHAEGCERCQAEIRWLTPAVNALPESVERLEPPRELRERVMAEVRFDAAPENAPAGEPAAGLFGRAGAWLRELGSGPMGLRPVVGFAAAVLVVAAVAGFAIGGGHRRRRRRPGRARSSPASRPGVTAKVVSEGEQRRPPPRQRQAAAQRPGARGLGAARRRSRTGRSPVRPRPQGPGQHRTPGHGRGRSGDGHDRAAQAAARRRPRSPIVTIPIPQ